MSPLLKGFVYAVACAALTLMLRMPDPLVIVVSGLGGVVGALD
jgi:hypothetical protein